MSGVINSFTIHFLLHLAHFHPLLFTSDDFNRMNSTQEGSFEHEKHVVGHHEHQPKDAGAITSGGHVTTRVVLTCFWAMTAALSYGFNAAIIASSLGQPNLFVYFDLLTRTDLTDIIGLIVGLLNVGGIFGVPACCYIADRWGRKIAFVFSGFFILLGAGLASGAVNLPMLILGRFFTGVGGWSAVLCAIVYSQEISPAKQRGALGGIIGVGLSCGYISAAWVGLGFFHLNDPINWRIPFIIQVVPTIINLAGVAFVPESPRWLCAQGRDAEALEVLKKLHGSVNDPEFLFAREECYQIVEQHKVDSRMPSSWGAMVGKYRMRSICAALVMIGQEGTGIPVIVSYGPLLYGQLGFSASVSLLIAAGWITMTLFLGPVAAVASDKFGRRTILWFSTFSAGSIVFAIFTALQAEYVGSTNKAGQAAAVAMIFVFMVFFGPQEPVGFLYIGEIFPSHIRVKGIAVGLTAINLMYVWITFSQPYGQAKAGWKYNLSFILLSLVVSILEFKYLPETKGVPLEEMAGLFGEEDDVAVRAKDIHFDSNNQITA